MLSGRSTAPSQFGRCDCGSVRMLLLNCRYCCDLRICSQKSNMIVSSYWAPDAVAQRPILILSKLAQYGLFSISYMLLFCLLPSIWILCVIIVMWLQTTYWTMVFVFTWCRPCLPGCSMSYYYWKKYPNHPPCMLTTNSRSLVVYAHFIEEMCVFNEHALKDGDVSMK